MNEVNKIPLRRWQSGFTLVEISIVLAIFALLVGGALTFLSSQRDIVHAKETEKRLSEVREALIGFAMAYDRLPCPANTGSQGEENPRTGGICASNAGFVPGVTLGIAPLNEEGFVIDAWGNPIRYAVTAVRNNTFTTTNALKTEWLANNIPAIDPNDLQVCNSSAAISGASCDTNARLAKSAVAVLVSTGKNGRSAVSPDELNNLNNNKAFVSHTPSLPDSPLGEFDDIVIWLSPNVFFNRMITAGRLP
ncbi:MAG: type II secretion system GspH family protein [Candidatus Accumulibacter sp.]|jgi:prepilin-type N-terminal cleavage/methylation domain-containing protein|nr:type II secretion system GspH family protein [Accumulibacter sp.]